jgi:putative ATP-binding cassette transporter
MILNMRRRLFDLARRSDLLTVERIGRAALHTVLIQNTQALARILPLLAIGAQQAVMLVFVGGYLAWLSPPAFLIAFGFGGIAVMVRMGRAVSLRRMLRKVGDAESRVFNGLTDLLQGFKEVRMERRRADAA